MTPPRITHPRTGHQGPRYRLAGKKSLGQHYLTDSRVLESILAAAELSPGDTVVEVGPGLGTLTRELVLQVSRVIAIEVDQKLAAALPGRLGHPTNLEVVAADAREVDLGATLRGVADYKLVANLPYYAANPILRRFLEGGAEDGDYPKPSIAVVMVQKEVANSIVAKGGRMSLLAVGVQLYGVPHVVCEVPAEAFDPPPKVTSSVVRIDVLPRPAIDVDSLDEFFDVVRAGFSAPRKQLRNSLGAGLGVAPREATRLVEEAGLDPARRAETLALDDWRQLYMVIRDGDAENGRNRADQGLREDKFDPGDIGSPP